MNSSIGRSYQASAPYSSKTDAARSTSAARQDRFAAFRRSRPPESARPRRAAARCTSRAGSQACCRCGRGPTPGSISRRDQSPRAPPPQRPRLTVRSAVGRIDRLAIHPDEPLRRRQEDHRIVTAPAVRDTNAESPADARAGPRSFSASSIWGLASKTSGRRTARRYRGNDRPVRPGHRCRARSSRRSRSRRRRGQVRCGRRQCPLRASRSRRAHPATGARTADAESGCARARLPSSARPAHRTSAPATAATDGASASATITARPSTS